MKNNMQGLVTGRILSQWLMIRIGVVRGIKEKCRAVGIHAVHLPYRHTLMGQLSTAPLPDLMLKDIEKT